MAKYSGRLRSRLAWSYSPIARGSPGNFPKTPRKALFLACDCTPTPLPITLVSGLGRLRSDS